MGEIAPELILVAVGNVPGPALLPAALRAAGFRVREAATGAQVLQSARERPDLLILGAGLPDMSRPELCRRLKADPDTARLLVLYVGDAGDPPPAGGVDGYLSDPVCPRTLLAHVRALLRLGRAEGALWASEARLRDILDYAPLIATVKDLEGRYLLVNRLWEQRFHIRREQILGRTVYDAHPRERADALLANDRRVLRTGTALEFEEVVPQDDGLHTYLSIKFPLADAHGRPYAVCGISTDITARKRAEEALRDSEALYHTLVESLPVCLLHKDVRGRFTYANRAFCTALKRPLAEVLGKTDGEFYPPSLAAKYIVDDRQVLDTGAVLEDIEEHQDPEGAKTYVQVLKAPLQNARGEVIGVQAIYWDITSRRRAEVELGQMAAEFRIARRIQQKLFPGVIPKLPGLDIAVASYGFDIGGASYPAEAIGGDYYDFVPLRDGSLGIAIGDVSGHGVGPALLMAEVRAFLRAFAQTETDVGAILGLVNRVLIPDVEDDRFVTLLLARLDPRARRFRYTSAGHHPGYVLDAAGMVRHTLASTSTPLGVFPENEFPAGPEVALAPGDLILLVTDGVADARAPDGTPFGVERTLDLVRSYRRAPAREIVANLYHGVRAFAQNLPQYDDITATVIKVAADADGTDDPGLAAFTGDLTP
jgi:sigma-B regulation protein RsbU (phosphoserine phosphatase)